jgi:hypothetical protein
MKQIKKSLLTIGVLAVGVTVVSACYMTIYPVCEPAGTVVLTDWSIILPCHQVTEQVVTGADAYYPESVIVSCGGYSETTAGNLYHISNVVPLIEITANPFPWPNTNICDVVSTPVGTTTIVCAGDVAGGAPCPACE